MAAPPTDRGLAVVRAEPDGTTTIFVCGQVVDGKPVDTYATHIRAAKVSIDPAVALVGAGSRRYTNQIVQVVRGEDGTVHVSRLTAGPAYV